MKYRSEIDGLRALAVVPVILFHAGFEIFSGGFIGVDVFFVISGYLITTILINDIERKQFSLVDFYERRARRILPALFFVILVCIPLAWMWMYPSQLKDFLQSLVAVNLFVSNIFFWKKSGYFDSPAEEMPLLHTWSLAVEEQYYALFPVFLILTWRFGRNKVFWIIVFMAVISLFVSEWGSRYKASASFYLIPTRAWELFAGSIAAFIALKRGVQNNEALSLLGAAAIVYSIFSYDESIPFPSSYTLLPVIGAVLLIIFAGKETLVARILSIRIFVGLGLISYSAYLWHQPLFAFAKIGSFQDPSKLLMASLSVLALLLAVISWKYIETPFRAKAKVNSKIVFTLSFSGIFIFTVLGIFGSFNWKLLDSGFLAPYYKLASLNIGGYSIDNKSLQQESWLRLQSVSNNKAYRVDDNHYDNKLWFDLSKGTPNLLLVGNSHSKDIYNILSQSNNLSSKLQIARYGVQIKDIGQKSSFWNSPNYNFSTHIVVATRYTIKDLENLPKILKRIKNDGKKVFLINNVFEFPGKVSGFSLIDKTVRQNLNLSIREIVEKVNSAYYIFYTTDYENRSHKINDVLSKVSEDHNIPILDRMDYICDDNAKKCFAVQENLVKNFYDYGHHTLSGSTYFSNSELLQVFLEELMSSVNND